jgi:hypothetical protein
MKIAFGGMVLVKRNYFLYAYKKLGLLFACILCATPLFLALFVPYNNKTFFWYLPLVIILPISLLAITGEYGSYSYEENRKEAKTELLYSIIPSILCIGIVILTGTILLFAPIHLTIMKKAILSFPIVFLILQIIAWISLTIFHTTPTVYQGTKHFSFSAGTLCMMYLYSIISSWDFSVSVLPENMFTIVVIHPLSILFIGILCSLLWICYCRKKMK